MKKIIALLATLAGLGWSTAGQAFTCQSLGTSISGSGTVNVNVNLVPSISAGQNLVVDLSQSIQCKNDAPSQYTDPVRIRSGSAYQGVLSAFRGSLGYFGVQYPFPTTTETAWVNHTWGDYRGWQAVLYLTPISTASGVVVKANTMIAQLILEKEDSINGNRQIINWNIYANNDVVVPTGGCDVSARNVTVNLPDYPGTAPAPVTVRCAQNQRIGYFLSGNTLGSDNSIFTNTSSSSPAQGIGVQLLRNGAALGAGSANTVSLGTVGTTPVSLGLTATYARTTGQVMAGNVQSIVGVTFVYQ